jgi:hypothetical protein
LGIYLCSSEQHASNVSLVLSLATGLVSPQFHAKHDDDFYTTSATSENIVPKSEWQEKCGFLDKPQRKTTKGPLMAPTDVYDEIVRLNPADNHQPTVGEQNEPQVITTAEVNEEPNAPQPEGDSTNGHNMVPSEPPVTTRSGRITGPPAHLKDYVAYESVYEVDDIDLPIDYLSPIVFATTSDLDTMYYHEAMAAPNRKNFLQAMDDEKKGRRSMVTGR